MNRHGCAHCWSIWLLTTLISFAYLETRAYHHRCHPTLSRELQSWTGVRPRKWWGRWSLSPLLFTGLGAWLTYHLLRLQEPEETVPGQVAVRISIQP